MLDVPTAFFIDDGDNVETNLSVNAMHSNIVMRRLHDSLNF